MTTTSLDTIDAKTTVAQIVLGNPAAARVFESRKIDYCCHGDTPVGEACRKAGVGLDEILAAIRDAARRFEAPARDWTEESLGALTDHILTTHHVFTRDEVQALPALSDKVRDVHGSSHAELTEVHRIVALLEPELLQHMMKEEQILFPFVTELEAAATEGREKPVPFFGTVRNPIRMMEEEHDAAGDMLAELRRLTSDYAIPDGACQSFENLYTRLNALEEDLHMHIHLENNVYFPRAIELENRVGG